MHRAAMARVNVAALGGVIGCYVGWLKVIGV